MNNKNRNLFFIVYLIALAGFLFWNYKTAREHKPAIPPAPAAQLMKEANAAVALATKYQTKASGATGASVAEYDTLATAQFKVALARFSQVEATYHGTGNAAEAIFQQASLLGTKVHVDNNQFLALQKLNELTNPSVMAIFGLAPDYRKVDFPSKAYVVPLKTKVARSIDYFYQHSDRSKWYYLWIPYRKLYAIMNFFVDLTGAKSYSYWIALLIISVIVRLALTPLTIKQYKSMSEMKRLQPLMKELQAKYKDDKSALSQRTMDLYKEHGVNPAGGCIPLLIQAPVFSAMYAAVRAYQYHFTHGTFLWIGSSLSHRFPQFLGTSLGQQDIPLLLLYSGSMYVTSRMMPAADPTQQDQQKMTAIMMSVFMFIMFLQYNMPSAFIFYFLISNIFATGTQIYFMRKGDITPPGTKVLLASDGDVSAKKNGNGNGNGSRAKSPLLPNGSTKEIANGEVDQSAPEGTAKGVMAPRKVHPKKKRR